MLMLNLHVVCILYNFSIHVVYLSNLLCTLLIKNDFLKMDPPFWGGVDVFRQRARVRVRALKI